MQKTAADIFSILVQDHELGLLAFVSAQLTDPGAAADVVQETFLAAWLQIDDFDQTRSFASYLRGIARHKIGDHLRGLYADRRAQQAALADRLTEIADEFDRQSPDHTELFDSRLAALRTCVGLLQPHARTVIEQGYMQGRTCAQMAASLGRNVEAVKKMLQRARAALARCMRERFREETADAR